MPDTLRILQNYYHYYTIHNYWFTGIEYFFKWKTMECIFNLYTYGYKQSQMKAESQRFALIDIV